MGLLCQCNADQNSTYRVLNQVGISSLNSIFCIGSHDGIQVSTYSLFGAQEAFFFECNPKVFPYLLERLKPYPNYKAFLEGLGDKDNEELEFYYYKEDTEGASSFCLPDLHLKYHPDYIVLPEITKITLNTLDTIIDKYNIDYTMTDCIDIDVQGCEEKVFRGSQKLLASPNLKYIICEVSWDNVYKSTNGIQPPLMKDIDNFLAQYDFKRKYVYQEWEIQGSAIYIRN